MRQLGDLRLLICDIAACPGRGSTILIGIADEAIGGVRFTAKVNLVSIFQKTTLTFRLWEMTEG